MYKKIKTTLPLIVGGLLFVTLAVVSCDSSEKKSESTETTITPPPPRDSTMDTGGVKPTPEGN